MRRRLLLVDADPVRPSGISSTDSEHALYLERRDAIAAHITDLGWPEPLAADSGNGGHLLYRIDEPSDDGGLIHRALQALAAQFNDPDVTVDVSVFNPARICKLYGTPARRG